MKANEALIEIVMHGVRLAILAEGADPDYFGYEYIRFVAYQYLQTEVVQ